MSPEMLTSTRELDARTADGMHVRLLWCAHDDRLWVTVLDTKSQETLRLAVDGDHSPLDVFHHPFAYASA